MNISTLINALPGACAQGLIWGIMAIGVYITYRILDIADLSVDGTMATGGAVCIMMLMSGHNIWVSMLAAAGAGMLAGLVTGILHTFMGIPAILAGILTQLSLYSINLKIMGKSNQAVNVNNYDLLVSLRYIRTMPLWKNTIFIVIVLTVLLIAILYWFFGTEFGASLRATGCNPNMSRAQGINTDFNKVIGLMLSNALVAFSSALFAQYQGFADVNMGRGAIVIGLAAVIIGEAIFGKIFRNFALSLLAVSFGAIIYYVVLQVVIWMGIDTDLLKLLSASVVAVFLGIPYWKGKYFTKPVHPEGRGTSVSSAPASSTDNASSGRPEALNTSAQNEEKGGRRNA
ncbi:MAG: ABC transporter permease [Lachnospiraceae bacterium]|nr:ABC transporter permease [Lachnospiraceae bacterium]